MFLVVSLLVQTQGLSVSRPHEAGCKQATDIGYHTNRLSISMCLMQFSPFHPSQLYLLTSQEETGKLTRAVTDQLQAHIDPFDLDVFMPYLLSALERQLQRSTVRRLIYFSPDPSLPLSSRKFTNFTPLFSGFVWDVLGSQRVVPFADGTKTTCLSNAREAYCHPSCTHGSKISISTHQCYSSATQTFP